MNNIKYLFNNVIKILFELSKHLEKTVFNLVFPYSMLLLLFSLNWRWFIHSSIHVSVCIQYVAGYIDTYLHYHDTLN